jgi:5-methylcytosine-specific restriction endonuclease McrA
MVSNGGCATCLLIHSDKRRKADPEKQRAAVAASKAKNIEKVRAAGRAYSKATQARHAAYRRNRNAAKRAAKLAARVPDPSDYAGLVVTRAQAKAAGAPKFYTGKPCIRNHLSQRVTSNGSCLQCNSEDWERFSHIRRARELGAEGSFTLDEIKALLQHQRGKCVYCARSIRKDYHVDHRVALARGGSNWISNIQLTCGPCNRRKGATDPIEYARRIGRLL